MKYFVSIEQAQVQMPGPALSVYRQQMHDLEGKEATLEIKERRPAKSKHQLGAIWGYIVPLIRKAMMDCGYAVFGVPPSADYVKQILYQTCGGVGVNGENKRLSEMDLSEANRFIKNIQSFAWDYLECDVPDPNPKWKEALCNPTKCTSTPKSV